MSTEDSNASPQRRLEPGSGSSRGERRDRPPRRRGGQSSSRSGEGENDSSESNRRGDRAPVGNRRDRGSRGGQGRRSDGAPRGNERPARGAGEPDTADNPAGSTPPSESSEAALNTLGGDLLASVSRSFSLTIRLLPEALREPISLGYLLARAQDTVADTPNVPAPTRLEHLRALLEMVKYGADAEVMPVLQRALAAKQKHEGEKQLIKELGRCLEWLEAVPVDDRWELRRTLARIGYAQELDLLRFGEGTAAEPKSLASRAELDEYTYLIAGCVGELWTRLCARHLEAGWSSLPMEQMLALGKRFGQGLQMVNILRDLPADLAEGRCYLPANMLAEEGLTVQTLTHEPTRARHLLATLRGEAVAHLDEAWKYVLAVKSSKLRYATALPVLIGLKTLGLLAQTSPLEAPERLKVSRSSMRGLMASAAVGAALTPWLNRLHAKLRRQAIG